MSGWVFACCVFALLRVLLLVSVEVVVLMQSLFMMLIVVKTITHGDTDDADEGDQEDDHCCEF